MATIFAQRLITDETSWAYTIRESADGRLYWLLIHREDSKVIPGVPVWSHFGLEDGPWSAAAVTPAEAEKITGLHSPVCFDKIRDLM